MTITLKAGDRVMVPMFAKSLAEARPDDWCEAMLLRYDAGGQMHYPHGGGEPYPAAPSWQVRILSGAFDKYLVSVEPDCIRPA